MEIRAFDDFYGLLADLENKASAWEKQNLFLTLSYLNKNEISAGIKALANRLQKPLDEISAEFQSFQVETERQRKNRR